MVKKFIILIFICSLLIAKCSSKQEPTAISTGSKKDFTLASLDGQSITLSELKGNVVLIDFWATWCPPCRNAIPHLITLYDKYKDQGFIILGISLEDEQALRMFRDNYQINYPILIGNKDLAQAYDVQAIPRSVFIDKNGNIRKVQIGFSPELASMFDAMIDSLVNE